MITYKVQHDAEGYWITAVREDLYDGTNDDVLEASAEFDTYAQADTFIGELRGLMHLGGEDVHFRIVRNDDAFDWKCLTHPTNFATVKP